MQTGAAWFSLAVAGIGWFYIFGSQSAQRLASLEAFAVNRRRVQLRCFNGGCMIALGTCIFAGVYSIAPASRPALFVGDWIAVMLLMGVSVALAWVDVRLTTRLRRTPGDSTIRGGGA